MRSITGSANALEKISIECTKHSFDGLPPQIDIEPLLGQESLARVREIFLSDLVATKHQLLRLCRYTSKTISSIEFRNVLEDKDEWRDELRNFLNSNKDIWRDVLRETREMDFPYLQSFVLDSCLEPYNTRSHVEDYVLRKSEDYRGWKGQRS